MGTALTGTTPQDTYDSLIKVTDNGPLSGSLKVLTDGLGNNSTLSLSTAAASIAGTLAVTGDAAFNTDTLFVDVSTGKVGIGTDAPTAPIQINGAPLESSPARATIRTFDTSSPAASVGAGLMLGYQYDTAQFVDAACVQAVKENGTLGNYATSLAFLTRANAAGFTEKVRILSSGGLTFNGDTAAANALDDYEEGTWTMGVAFGGASVGVTTSQSTGSYTKIGRQVTVNGYLQLSSKGSSTGNAVINNLPFTIANTNSNYSSPSLWFTDISFANQFQAYGDVNSTNILLQEITTLGARTSITDADFANNSGIIVSFTYFV